jgi:hypothetical protein
MKLQIRVDEHGVISDVKFKTFGCGSAIASSSYMTERVKGMTLEQAGQVKNTEIAKELCLPPVKRESRFHRLTLRYGVVLADAARSALLAPRGGRNQVGHQGLPGQAGEASLDGIGEHCLLSNAFALRHCRSDDHVGGWLINGNRTDGRPGVIQSQTPTRNKVREEGKRSRRDLRSMEREVPFESRAVSRVAPTWQ